MNPIDLSDPARRTFPAILRQQAKQNGDTPFLVSDLETGAERISFAEADALSDRLAAGLAALGVARGDRVAFYLGSRSEMVLLALAVNKLGAVWTPVSTDYKGDWLRDTLERSRARVLVTEDAYRDRIDGVLPALGAIERVVLDRPADSDPEGAHDYAELLRAEPLESDYADLHYGDTCAVLWTSGTTGKSKGVMQSYNGWMRAILKGGAGPYESREGDVILCVLPLFHSAAWVTCIYRALLEGITVALDTKFSVSQFWDRVRHFGATQTFVLGAMGVFLWNAEERPDDADTPLRVGGIVPMPPDLWKPFEKRFGMRLVRSGLGQSELLSVMTQWGASEDLPLHSLGYPPDDIEIRLCDDDGNEVASGSPGEICARALEPHVLFNGYFDNPEASAEAFFGDWYRTGDMARQDPETGAYYFVDRKKDALRYAGRNISTMEVESVVRRHPAVQDVAAFGIRSQEVESEHELKINVVLAPDGDVDPETLCRFINDNAPYYFVPRYLEFVDALPYTPTNKVQKFALRDAGITPGTWDRKQTDFEIQR